MGTGALYHKNMKTEIADVLLREKSSFEKISKLTGWTTEEIWLYITLEYRKKYPRQYEADQAYYCWGENQTKVR